MPGLTNRLVAPFAVSAALLAVFWAVAVPFPAPHEYAEGDTATWVWLERHGEAIYGPLDGATMRRTNYPPIYLHLVAKLAPSDEAILPVGRAVSLVGFALALLAVGLSVARATGSRRAGAIAALVLAGTLRCGLWAATCRPDALGFGLGALGVALVSLRVRGWPIAAAIAFATALLVKHSLIVFPVGAIAWALVRERRAGLLLAVATGGLVAAAVVWGGLFLPLVLASEAGWQASTLASNLAFGVAPSLIGLALVGVTLRRWGALPPEAQRALGPWAGVWIAGLAWLPSLGRVGANFNYLLELLAATAVLATVAAFGGARRRLFAQGVASAIETAVWVGALLFLAMPAARREIAEARRALAGGDGPVLAEQSWYATSAGRPPVIIPFLATQLARAGRWDAAPLVEDLRQGRVQTVLLGFPLDPLGVAARWHEERFPPATLEALRARYHLSSQSGDLYIYRPR